MRVRSHPRLWNTDVCSINSGCNSSLWDAQSNCPMWAPQRDFTPNFETSWHNYRNDFVMCRLVANEMLWTRCCKGQNSWLQKWIHYQPPATKSSAAPINSHEPASLLYVSCYSVLYYCKLLSGQFESLLHLTQGALCISIRCKGGEKALLFDHLGVSLSDTKAWEGVCSN